MFERFCSNSKRLKIRIPTVFRCVTLSRLSRSAGIAGSIALRATVLFLASGLAVAETTHAEPRKRDLTIDFPVPTNFEARIAFWRDVFTKYGKNHRVFHHREHPEIIYSVLDFSELENGYNGRKLERIQEQAIEEEIDRIQQTLEGLGSGREPKDDRERRLQVLFRSFTSGNRSAYRDAADVKMIRYQTGIRERFRDGLIRSGRYLYAIERIFGNQGLPLGLSRLPLVESSFDYRAYSSAGAAGIWQFTRSTGKKYMVISSSMDERRDPIIASRSAAAYLRNSYLRTQDWGLAVTSYNHGLQGVLNAANSVGSRDLGIIARKYKGSGFGFASSNFYAEFLAALEVEQRPEKYFPGLRRETPWYFDEVRIGRSVRLSDLSRLTSATSDELSELNLAFGSPVMRNAAVIPAGTVVKVPPGKGRRVTASISASTLVGLGPAQAVSPIQVAAVEESAVPAQSESVQRAAEPAPETVAAQSERAIIPSGTTTIPAAAETASSERAVKPRKTATYRVVKGDSLGKIAKKLGVGPRALMAFNGIEDPRKIRTGAVLKIPEGQDSGPAEPEIAPRSQAAVEVVRQEAAPDTGLQGDMPAAASEPRASEPKAQVQRDRSQTTEYTIGSGDTLGSIAKKLNVSINDLTAANEGLDPRRLKPGKKILLPAGAQRKDDGETAAAAEGTDTASVKDSGSNTEAGFGDTPAQRPSKTKPEAQATEPKATYVVQSNDTLSGIAKKQGISVKALTSANRGIDPKRLRPGQKLVIAGD